MSVQKQAREPFLRIIRSLFRLLILLSFISEEMCEEIHCPRPFRERTMGQVNCSLNVTKIMSSCFPAPTSVLFGFSNTTVTDYDLCNTPFNGTCDQVPVGDMKCSCVKSDADIHTYQLNFVGSKTMHSGGNITCSVLCLPTALVVRNDSCSFLEFVNSPY